MNGGYVCSFWVLVVCLACFACDDLSIEFAPSADGDQAPDGDVYPDGDTLLPYSDGDVSPDGDALPDGDVSADGDADIPAETGSLWLEPAALDFGLEYEGCASRRESVTIGNPDAYPVTIQSISVVSSRDNVFRLIGAPDLPIILTSAEQGEFMSIQTSFNPRHVEEYDGVIKIVTDHPTASVNRIPLTGIGIEAEHLRDEWQIPAAPMIDILWVIDCSESMEPAIAARVSDMLLPFLQIAIREGDDIHMAAVSTNADDPQSAGVFLTDPPVLKTAGPEAMSANDILERFGGGFTTCPSVEEKGLEALQIALSEPWLNELNAGFLREDAKLVVIIVADEDDQSGHDVVLMLDFIRNIKGLSNANMLEIYAVVGDDPDGCESGDGPTYIKAKACPKYIAFADGGNVHDDAHFMSICAGDYSPVLDNIIDRLFMLSNQFYLSRLPREESIEVWVNDLPDSSWTYDSDSNSLVFPYEAMPPLGAMITSEYDVACW